MKFSFTISPVFCCFVFSLISCKNVGADRHLLGNTIQNFEYSKNKNGIVYAYDAVDDSVHFKHVIDDFYIGDSNKVYLLTSYTSDALDFMDTIPDTLRTVAYFEDYTDIIDLKTYKKLGNDAFTTKGKVFIWWANDTHAYASEAEGADPATFYYDTISHIYKDEKHVMNDDDFPRLHVEKGMIPEKARSIGNPYVTSKAYIDAKHVFFEDTILTIAEPNTFTFDSSRKFYRDTKHVFAGNKLALTKGADPATFQSYFPDSSGDNYYHDKNRVYFGEPGYKMELVSGADVKTFVVGKKGNSDVHDKLHHYSEGKMVK